ncbi:TnsA-like heteromeric transposase endonuclease subunit [Nocardia sp. NRRL S-836]|uniref:TnsA-like heteromeric transposase endonuclease subunit n=1 Tax=Nocardia sp. NRRL S-836 TaxID=1519492 RepID=UPI0012F76B80|nr:TnsA-like heteromeric transposase endonuclease subunit [Nocardia sp. NRRL S-836]
MGGALPSDQVNAESTGYSVEFEVAFATEAGEQRLSLVGFESWLERDRLMLLDFDPDTVGLASQPYWLFWTTAEARSRSHAPDYFARLADGTAIVLDCRPLDRIKPKDEVAFEATRAACELLGWRYEIVGTPPEVLLANVRWLAGYRHPRHDLHVVAQTLRAVFSRPMPLWRSPAHSRAVKIAADRPLRRRSSPRP